MSDERTAELKTLELIDDHETVRCDGHDHVCRFLWLAIRSVLAESARQRERIIELEATLMRKSSGDWTH